MRIGVYLGKMAPATVGGSSVFQDEILKELVRQNKDFEFYVYYFGNIKHISDGSNIKFVRLNKIFLLMDRLYTIKDLRFLLTFGCKARYSFLNKIVKRDSIDLMYFPFPFSFAETEIPYLYTVWDLGGDAHPYFPEVSVARRNFEVRKRLYRRVLPKAMFVLIGNDTGKNQLTEFYHVSKNRIVTNPMITPSYIYSVSPDEGIQEKYRLEKGKFLFYPAQFWPHKNHIRVVEAMKDLSQSGYKLVLSGSDQGNLDYIKSKVAEFGLEEHVVFVGFVSQEEIVGLYKNAFALVYASAMGPDNIPPLEAMGLGCPVICSRYDGAEEQLKDAALFFDPYDTDEIVSAVRKLEGDHGLRDRLIRRGRELSSKYGVEKYAGTVFDTFRRAALIRECWG